MSAPIPYDTGYAFTARNEKAPDRLPTTLAKVSVLAYLVGWGPVL